ncbi:MAG TPA: hypothetical protein VEL31_11730, partial [Ktedonobacteraceae bacterium]|nr:hypothetical protein [Ktedonobacteraceae bacterium]
HRRRSTVLPVQWPGNWHQRHWPLQRRSPAFLVLPHLGLQCKTHLVVSADGGRTTAQAIAQHAFDDDSFPAIVRFCLRLFKPTTDISRGKPIGSVMGVNVRTVFVNDIGAHPHKGIGGEIASSIKRPLS